ncbi:MAG: flagellar hook-associated protein FlgL [Thermoanaerobacteraceae bacterium]|nr:flagellar hook-associated protein FlgL [Thermoanaerobacteraceae bacterium]
MRITNKMIKMSSLNSLTANLKRLNDLQEKLSSGKNVVRPSDNPVLTTRAMDLTRSLKEMEQYTRNVEDSISWLNLTDSALDDLTAIFHRVRELATRGASESVPEYSRKAIAKEVDQLIDQVIAIGNTTYGGRYIFAGYKTVGGEKPFVRGKPHNGDGGLIKREISPGVEIAVNVTGKEVFTVSGIFDETNIGAGVLNDLKVALETGDTDTISKQILGRLDQALDKVLEVRARVGARVNRLELMKNRWAEGKINYTQLLSEFQDIDVAEVVTQLKTEENVYQTALAAIARTIQPSLINYLQ